MSRGADVLPNTQCPLQQDHCPWVISGPLWELLREHPGFILQLHSVSLVQQVLSDKWCPTGMLRLLDKPPGNGCILKRLMLCTVWERLQRVEMSSHSLGEGRESFHFMKCVWVATSFQLKIGVSAAVCQSGVQLWLGKVSAGGFKDGMGRAVVPKWMLS